MKQTDAPLQILAEYEISLMYEELSPEEVFVLGFLKALDEEYQDVEFEIE